MVSTCTTCRATTQGWSTNHGIWIPGVPGHPSRIYPGSSGNRSSMPGIHFFSISGDPGCPDDEKVKKLSGTTFFCSGALFLSRSTFLSLEHFFSKSAHISDIPNWMSIQLWMTFIRYDTTTCRYRVPAPFGYAQESARGEASNR